MSWPSSLQLTALVQKRGLSFLTTLKGVFAYQFINPLFFVFCSTMCTPAQPVGLYTELTSTTHPSCLSELSCRCSSAAAGSAPTARSDLRCFSLPGTSYSTATTPGKVITITTPTRSASSQLLPSMHLGTTPKASPPPKWEVAQSWLLRSPALGWRQWTRWRWWCWTPQSLEAVGWQAPGVLGWSRI